MDLREPHADDRLTLPAPDGPRILDWGERLSDRIRRLLDAGDLTEARRLCVRGDGHARSLEKEYALMYKGLGITLRVMLGLAEETVRSHADPGPRPGALAVLLERFRREMGYLLRQASGAADAAGTGRAPEPNVAEALGREIALSRQLIEEAEHLFDREQARLAVEVVQAIETGNVARARAALDVKERGQYVPLHDRLVRLMAEIFGFVLKWFGATELYRFHRATAEEQRRGFENWERLPAAEFARASAFLLKQHMGTVTVWEDAEKYTILQAPCGSGGRLRLAGTYAGPAALPFVEEPGPLTLGQPRFPVYCSHCPIWNAVAPMEWFGRPHWVFENPSREDGSCTLHVYKRRDGAPAAYAQQLGFRR